MKEFGYKSLLTDDPNSGLKFAQMCVGFARENRREFITYIQENSGYTFPRGALKRDFKMVLDYLEVIKQLSDIVSAKIGIHVVTGKIKYPPGPEPPAEERNTGPIGM